MDAVDKINIRLKTILEYINRLKKYQGIKAEELAKDHDKSAIVERYTPLPLICNFHI